MKTIRKRFILIFLIFIFTVFGFYNNAEAQDTISKVKNAIKIINNSIKDTQEYKDAKKYINDLSNNDSVYFGEGTVKIGDDIAKAIKKAKNEVQKDLSEKIKVKVKSTVIKDLISRAKFNEEDYSEEIIKSFQSKINTYTENILLEINYSRNFINYPDSGYLTIFADINKNVYKKNVEKDISEKKNLIRTCINNGDKEFLAKHHIQAVNSWINAKENLNNFFNGIPVEDNLGENKNLQNISEYINGKISFFFSGITLNDITGETRYDAKGRLNKPIMIYAKYKDEYGHEQAVTRLPLKAEFIEGEGNILQGIVTGDYGQAKLSVSYINPANRKVVIRITVDKDRINNLNNFMGISFPSIDISLKKTRTIAFAVSFNNNGKKLSPGNLKNSIQTILLNHGLAIVSSSISSDMIKNSDIQKVNNTNSDYLLYVYINTLRCSTVGGYENMYIAPCSGTVYIYKLPYGNLVASQQLPTVKGYGASGAGAGYDGLNKLNDSVLKITKSLLEEIK